VRAEGKNGDEGKLDGAQTRSLRKDSDLQPRSRSVKKSAKEKLWRSRENGVSRYHRRKVRQKTRKPQLAKMTASRILGKRRGAEEDSLLGWAEHLGSRLKKTTPRGRTPGFGLKMVTEQGPTRKRACNWSYCANPSRKGRGGRTPFCPWPHHAGGAWRNT